MDNMFKLAKLGAKILESIDVQKTGSQLAPIGSVNYRSINNNRNSFSTNTGRNEDLNDSDDKKWPVRKVNTILNILPQGKSAVIERLGSFNSVKTGMFFAIPLIDKISYIIDKREQSIRIDPLHAITADNISIMVSGNLFIQFDDEKKVAYGSDQPLYNITQFAISSMRNSIGNMELDEILKNRQQINKDVMKSLESSSVNWGLVVKRYEITDLNPDQSIIDSMNKQLIGERNRREQILTAKGQKESAQLISEGDLIKVTNEAEANRRKLVMDAQGRAEAIELEAHAKSKYIKILSESLNTSGESGIQAVNTLLAIENINMMSKIGQSSNTMFFSDKPADFRQLMAYTSEIINVKK
jgi:regulator of protease activity HflC (stomatin/prohibitin superfamily)